MIALLQRVREARVEVAAQIIGEIQRGVLCFIGVERSDTETQAERLLERMLGYRMFEDAEGKMNLSVKEIQGGLLLVSQFTLAADTGKGMRPSFTPAAPPAEGERLFNYLVQRTHALHQPVATGRFGANMQVSLINEGPVTFWLQT